MLTKSPCFLLKAQQIEGRVAPLIDLPDLSVLGRHATVKVTLLTRSTGTLRG